MKGEVARPPRIVSLCVALAIGFMAVKGAIAAPYQWRSLTIYIGSTTGGSYDLNARILALYIGKYLPGHPTVTPENRPGAGGLSLMNQMYADGARDGTEIATLSPGFIVDRVVYGDKSQAHFNPTQFNWLGSFSNDPNVFIAWGSRHFTFKQVIAGRPMVVGMPGPGGGPWFYSLALNAVTGSKLKIISGYPGLAQVELALEGGELDGIAGTTWNGVKAAKQDWLTAHRIDVLAQYTQKRLPDLPNVPTIGEFVKEPKAAAIFDFGEQLDQIKYPFFAPPGVPADRVALLRKAFDQAMRDPGLVAAAKRARLSIDPMSGVELTGIVNQITRQPDDIVRRLRKIYAN
jgi:tripartite-type tricarboxylate transporter receptor subunit TctC